jgi:hypothetical protein
MTLPTFKELLSTNLLETEREIRDYLNPKFVAYSKETAINALSELEAKPFYEIISTIIEDFDKVRTTVTHPFPQDYIESIIVFGRDIFRVTINLRIKVGYFHDNN